MKDRDLRDEPVPGEHVYSMNRPETHDVYREWRRIADSYTPPRLLVGEAYVLDLTAWATFYGSGRDELDLAFNFRLVHADLEAAQMRTIVAGAEAALPVTAWPCWTGSNHDAGRLATRWCGGDEALARCALLMLVTLRGTPFLYYGDEFALTDGGPAGRVRDVAEPRATPPHADAVDPRRRLEGSLVTPRGHGSQRRRSTRRPLLDSPLHARPDRTPQVADLRVGAYDELPARTARGPGAGVSGRSSP